VVSISEKIAEYLGIKNIKDIKRGALLSKADLVTNMVGEFPDLQGVVGKYYAQHDKENNIVSTIICDHYLPKGRGDECPKLKESAIVSIADKIDSIVGLFYIGESPSSSKDPYALRRSALGIIRILIESKFSITVQKLVELSILAHKVSGSKKVLLAADIHKFFYERFRYFLKNDFNECFILAVLNKSEGSIYLDFEKITALSKYLTTPEGKNLSFAAKRVHSILVSCESVKQEVIKKDLFLVKEEKDLFYMMESIERNITKSLESENYLQAFEGMSPINLLIDSFFDKTMIMVEDEKLKSNRVALLRRLDKALSGFIDFSVIEL
jgi:glycyl-tRNA synthetase beta chain